MNKPNRINYIVAVYVAPLYFAGEATGLLFPAMLIILPVRCWVLWNLRPDGGNPSIESLHPVKW